MTQRSSASTCPLKPLTRRSVSRRPFNYDKGEIMGIKRFALICAIALLASGCASGPKYAEVKSAIPAQKTNEGRVFVYRNSSLGAAVQPNVMVNDKVAGESQ